MIVAGIDMGTQSVKVALYDAENRQIVSQAQQPLDLIAENDGTREQKTEWYTAALDSCFAMFTGAERGAVCAIGISGHQHGFVPLDAQGNSVYNVKLWNDTSTQAECEFITKEAGGDDAVISEICNLMLPGFTAPKILWLKKHKKSAFERLRYIMLPHDYLNYLFTGEYRAEEGDTSGTALYNGAKRAWSKKICSIIGEKLFGLLPPVIAADEPNGFVQESAAKRWNIPQGIPVSSGGGDNMMGAIGTGTVEDGFLTMSLGTSGTLYGYSNTPVSDPKNGISGFSASTGGFLPLLCTMNCTVASEELRSLFGMSVKEFDEAALSSAPGSKGVVVLPFFNGERTPNLPGGRASIMGLSAANASRANIARAALESAIFGMRGGLDAFNALGFKAREIRIIGGGSKSAVWRRMAADIMNLPVKRPVNDEAAAIGAAIQALWCLEKQQGRSTGIAALCAEHIALREDECVMPEAANVAAYKSAYSEYNKYLNALSPLYR
ncbi:MAG: xylulokinase [Spirochaetaceae bacterium]|jgi:xylulokinase|nr:xylulokinase [Spirochaetaceae bacterium]